MNFDLCHGVKRHQSNCFEMIWIWRRDGRIRVRLRDIFNFFSVCAPAILKKLNISFTVVLKPSTNQTRKNAMFRFLVRVWKSLGITVIVSFFQMEIHSLRQFHVIASRKYFPFHEMMADFDKKVLIKRSSRFLEAAKKVFLKFLQISEENTCVEVSF